MDEFQLDNTSIALVLTMSRNPVQIFTALMHYLVNSRQRLLMRLPLRKLHNICRHSTRKIWFVVASWRRHHSLLHFFVHYYRFSVRALAEWYGKRCQTYAVVSWQMRWEWVKQFRWCPYCSPTVYQALPWSSAQSVLCCSDRARLTITWCLTHCRCWWCTRQPKLPRKWWRTPMWSWPHTRCLNRHDGHSLHASKCLAHTAVYTSFLVSWLCITNTFVDHAPGERWSRRYVKRTNTAPHVRCSRRPQFEKACAHYTSTYRMKRRWRSSRSRRR